MLGGSCLLAAVLLVNCGNGARQTSPSPPNEASKQSGQGSKAAVMSEGQVQDSCASGPQLRVVPQQGPIGTRVRLAGQCFGDSYYDGDGVFLLRQFFEPRECEIMAFAKHRLRFGKSGSLRGHFTVPGNGACSQHDYSRRVTPSRYFVGIGCHSCLHARFRVTKH